MPYNLSGVQVSMQLTLSWPFEAREYNKMKQHTWCIGKGPGELWLVITLLFSPQE